LREERLEQIRVRSDQRRVKKQAEDVARRAEERSEDGVGSNRNKTVAWIEETETAVLRVEGEDFDLWIGELRYRGIDQEGVNIHNQDQEADG